MLQHLCVRNFNSRLLQALCDLIFVIVALLIIILAPPSASTKVVLTLTVMNNAGSCCCLHCELPSLPSQKGHGNLKKYGHFPATFILVMMCKSTEYPLLLKKQLVHFATPTKNKSHNCCNL